MCEETQHKNSIKWNRILPALQKPFSSVYPFELQQSSSSKPLFGVLKYFHLLFLMSLPPNSASLNNSIIVLNFDMYNKTICI